MKQTVFYDGDCGLCQRTARLFRRLDVFNQLEWVDFRRTPTPIDPDRLEHEMAVTSGAQTYFGFAAYRAMSWRIPVFWPVLPILYFPGVRPIGEAVYRWVAENRHGTCRIPSGSK